MKWQEIREHYPHQWLLVKAIKAHSQASKRILDQLSVVSSFDDSLTAMSSSSPLNCTTRPRNAKCMFFTPAALIWISRSESGWGSGERDENSLAHIRQAFLLFLSKKPLTRTVNFLTIEVRN